MLGSKPGQVKPQAEESHGCCFWRRLFRGGQLDTENGTEGIDCIRANSRLGRWNIPWKQMK
jgi:hypothetical protein